LNNDDEDEEDSDFGRVYLTSAGLSTIQSEQVFVSFGFSASQHLHTQIVPSFVSVFVDSAGFAAGLERLNEKLANGLAAATGAAGAVVVVPLVVVLLASVAAAGVGAITAAGFGSLFLGFNLTILLVANSSADAFLKVEPSAKTSLTYGFSSSSERL